MNRRDFLLGSGALLTSSSLLDARAATALVSRSESGTDDRLDLWSIVASQFEFEEGLIYLNNGSLGPSPRIVRDATDEFRRQLDLFPSKYMWSDWWDDRELVRKRAAELLNAPADFVALTHNTCEGLNLVASSLELESGDEIIASTHEHHTGVVPLQHFQESRGVKLVRPELPLLPKTPSEIVDVYQSAITPRTKAILISHMVNTNGMIMPVQELCEISRKRGILTIIDGAQAVGQMPVDVSELGCDFYAASGHKWLFGPKGTGLFYVHPERLHLLKPLIVSSAYYKEKNARQFENYNTRNVPEVLGLGVALDYNRMLASEAIHERVIELKHYLRNRVEETVGLRMKSPANDGLTAGINNVEVIGKDVQEVAKTLDERHRINCRPMAGHNLNSLRISTAVYNSETQIDALVAALAELS